MRQLTKNSIAYQIDEPPRDPSALGRYLYSELLKIQATIQGLSDGHLDMTHVPPAKPRDGDIRLADGTDWDPGSGQGLYCYYGGVWNLLG